MSHERPQRILELVREGTLEPQQVVVELGLGDDALFARAILSSRERDLARPALLGRGAPQRESESAKCHPREKSSHRDGVGVQVAFPAPWFCGTCARGL